MSTLTPDARASQNRHIPNGFQPLPTDLHQDFAYFKCEPGTLDLTPVWMCNHCGMVLEYDPEPPFPPERKDEMSILLETLSEIDRDYRRYRKLFDEATARCDILSAGRYHDVLIELDAGRTAVMNDCHAEVARCRS